MFLHVSYVQVFGYGAALPPANVVSHCFNVSGNPASPMVSGVDGILAAYHAAVSSVTFSGPTLFQHVIDNAARVTQADAEVRSLSNNKYVLQELIGRSYQPKSHKNMRSLIHARETR